MRTDANPPDKIQDHPVGAHFQTEIHEPPHCVSPYLDRFNRQSQMVLF